MQIRIARTREDQEPGERDCAICRNVFWLGEATTWAITYENTLIGEVCPACLEGGASHIEAKLEERARLSRVIAEQDERIASESVEDVPSVGELLVAETFYGSGDERSLPCSLCPGRLLGATLIHPTSENRFSQKSACRKVIASV